MHMSDALLSPAVAGGMYACSGVAVAAAVAKLRKSPETVKVAEAGVMGAFVFAAQMINFSIPGTGSSGHLCGGMLLSAVHKENGEEKLQLLMVDPHIPAGAKLY